MVANSNTAPNRSSRAMLPAAAAAVNLTAKQAKDGRRRNGAFIAALHETDQIGSDCRSECRGISERQQR